MGILANLSLKLAKTLNPNVQMYPKGLKVYTQREIDLAMRLIRKEDIKKPFDSPTDMNNFNLSEQAKKNITEDTSIFNKPL